MADTFDDKVTAIIAHVGRGKLTATVRVDQVYAKYQHERLDLRHPEGGRAKYLIDPMIENYSILKTMLANSIRRGFEGNVVKAMIDVSEAISHFVYLNAPLEFGDLKASASPSVKDGRRIVYRRAPNTARLTKEQLRIKQELRNLGFGNR